LGDAVDVARALCREGLEGKVDLIYLDPPYASGANYTHEERMDGTATGRVARSAAYRDRWEDGPASYLDMLYPSLSAMRPLLKPSGSIWVQVDWRASYLVRALCDEIFGRDRFLNEIVWRRAPNLGRQARSGQFGRTLDTIVVYGGGREARLVPPSRLLPIRESAAKKDPETGRFFTVAPRGDYTDDSVARLESEGRIYRTPTGKIYVKYWLEHDAEGRLCKRQPVDALWTDVPPLRHVSPEERTGYPTQKPRALLERILLAGCPEGGLVVDLFAGSGTTGAAAAALNRSFVLADQSPVALSTLRARLLRQAALPLTIELCGRKPPRDDGGPRLSIRRLGADSVRAVLRGGEDREPIAWAIGVLRAKGGPLRVASHNERGVGRRPSVLAREMDFVIPEGCSRLSARVYFVDGSTAELSAQVPAVDSAPYATAPGDLAAEEPT
jgi:site-specific DNA-methyltransferase (adenine-specific)/adenine-specific DNA-methyltransferase